MFGKKRNTESKSTGFYFENIKEMVVYARSLGDDHDCVDWLGSKPYFEEYQKGYQLFEQQRYKDAIKAYQNTLKLNPVGVRSRFEICECYIALKDYTKAKKTLLDATPYLYEDALLARFYRRMGYIAIEEHKYQLAVACYQYSRRFEDHPSIPDELLYIATVGKINIDIDNIEDIIKKNGLPLLTKPTLETKA